VRSLALLLFFVAGACTRERTSDAKPDPSARPPVDAPPQPIVEERFACVVDADCRLSCAYGAVASKWYEEHVRQECKDGCASQVMSVRCVDLACVAFRDGVRDASCSGPQGGTSKKLYPMPKPKTT